MTPPSPNSASLIQQEIFDDARQRQQEILQRARQEADAIIAKAEKEAEQFRREALSIARDEAQRRSEAILATVSIETGRMRSARLEELLRAIYDRAREQLRNRSGFDYRKTMVRLCVQALNQMAGTSFRLRLSAGERRTLGDGLSEEIQHGVERPIYPLQIVPDPGLREGDFLIEDASGHQVWDLSLDGRLERCWPELRRQIASSTAFSEFSST